MMFKELRKQSGMTQKQFADYFGIPHRTIQNWEGNVNKCPEYLLNLMEYRLKNEGENTPADVVRIRNDDMKELHRKIDDVQRERMEALKSRSYKAEWIQPSALCNPYCSNCKSYNDRKTTYCPNCGNKMA